MPDPRQPLDPVSPRQLRLAWLVLLWEGLWPALWPLPALILLFVDLVLFDILPALPGWLHAGLLVAFAATLPAVLWRLRQWEPPSPAAVRRRLEQDNGLTHRPLDILADDLAGGHDDPVAQALWQVQRRRAAALLRRLRLRPPRPVLARHDPWGLRFVPLLLLAVALCGPWSDPGARLQRALDPALGQWGAPAAVLQVWLTPPDYTGIAPSLLESLPPGQSLQVPAGSKLLAQLQGGHGTATLLIDSHAQSFDSLGPDSQRLEATIGAGHRLTVRQGPRRIADWAMTVVPDQPPSIAWTTPPARDGDGRLQLSFRAQDDYGVASAWVVVRRIDMADAEPLRVPLPLGTGSPKDVRQSDWLDLTGHPWAGLKVTLQPAAQDAAGQTAFGSVVPFTLPERRFTNPVAQAVIDQRRLLAEDPASRLEVGESLVDIAANLDSYHGDVVVFMALSLARSRLQLDPSDAAVPSVLDILWQTALKLEDGDRPAAEQALDQASRDLQDALARNASAAELDHLTDQLQAAMAQYLEAMRQEAARQGQPDLPVAPGTQVITPQELRQMLDQMRDLARTGSRDAAEQMLAQLRQTMESLRHNHQTEAQVEAARQARKALDQLQAVAHDQSALLDQTFQHQQNPAANRDKGPTAEAQEALRQRLGDAMQSMADLGADIPDSLGQADAAMRDATKSLRKKEWNDAADAQGEALDELSKGAQQAAQAMARQTGGGAGMIEGALPGRDPLGRPVGPGAADRQDTRIPDHAEVQKAREVLDELRRRSDDAQRPAPERDYLQRLLRQFN